MAEQTYTKAQVDAMIAKAGGLSDFDATAARPYQVIKDADGKVICYPPTGLPTSVDGHNGPWTIGGQHPDDHFNVDDKGVAQEAKPADKPADKAAPAKDAKATAAAADDAEYQQYLEDKAARDAAAGGN